MPCRRRRNGRTGALRDRRAWRSRAPEAESPCRRRSAAGRGGLASTEATPTAWDRGAGRRSAHTAPGCASLPMTVTLRTRPGARRGRSATASCGSHGRPACESEDRRSAGCSPSRSPNSERRGASRIRRGWQPRYARDTRGPRRGRERRPRCVGRERPQADSPSPSSVRAVRIARTKQTVAWASFVEWCAAKISHLRRWRMPCREAGTIPWRAVSPTRQSAHKAPKSRRKEHVSPDLEAHEPAKLSDWIRAGLPVAALAIFIAVAWRHGYFDLKNPEKLDAAAQRVQDIPWLGPIFVVMYSALAMLAAPVSPLAYGAGAVFGVIRGTLFVLLASLIGATGGYFVARSAWSGVARRLL